LGLPKARQSFGLAGSAEPRPSIDLGTGRIFLVVSGTGAGLEIDGNQPDTSQLIVGTKIPDWDWLQDVVLAAAPVFAGIRTQSWDVALTGLGSILMEVNFGGDLNLAQLATGRGVLDEGYREYLGGCGPRLDGDEVWSPRLSRFGGKSKGVSCFSSL
jgi:hypothetical protein